MFRFDNLLEKWAQMYKPLSHDPIKANKHRTFFRIAAIDTQSEFVRNYNDTPSPCMAYSTHIDAVLTRTNRKTASYRHVIYFLVKQKTSSLSNNSITDDMEATECRYETDDLVQDLLAWLYELKKDASANALCLSAEDREALRGLDLDGAEWATIPVKYNGWWICGLEISQITPRRLCVNPEKYLS